MSGEHLQSYTDPNGCEWLVLRGSPAKLAAWKLPVIDSQCNVLGYAPMYILIVPN